MSTLIGPLTSSLKISHFQVPEDTAKTFDTVSNSVNTMYLLTSGYFSLHKVDDQVCCLSSVNYKDFPLPLTFKATPE